jgi:hypothetical protein
LYETDVGWGVERFVEGVCVHSSKAVKNHLDD